MATALRTARYPGWSIERIAATEFFMLRDAGLFAASVTYSEQFGWMAELLTKQRGSWEPAKTPCVHGTLGVTREADRRAAWIARCERKPLTRKSA